MIFGRIFYAEKGSIDMARRVLMNDFGLIPPKWDPFNRTEDSVLVWEDSGGIGRYRVHFYHDCKRWEGSYEGIQFKYWMNDRMKPEIFEKDPMNDAVISIRQSLKGQFFEEELGRDKTIDQVLQQ